MRGADFETGADLGTAQGIFYEIYISLFHRCYRPSSSVIPSSSAAYQSSPPAHFLSRSRLITALQRNQPPPPLSPSSPSHSNSTNRCPKPPIASLSQLSKRSQPPPKAAKCSSPAAHRIYPTQLANRSPKPPSPPLPPLMAQEFVFACHDLRKDATNNDKLVNFVRRYYMNQLNATEFYSALQPRLNPTNEPIIDQYAHVTIQNFFHDLSSLYIEHSTMEKTLKSMDQNFDKQLCCIDISKKVSAVFFVAVAMICTALAVAAAANANPKTKRAAVAAGAASILFGALGKWIYALLNKRETADMKHKKITALMNMGARLGMKNINSIHIVARRLQYQIKSKKMDAAMKNS